MAQDFVSTPALPVSAAPKTSDQVRAREARAVLEVDLAAIRHNARLAARLAPGARVMAVMKGDAYGLGAGAAATELQAAGIPAFAVDSVAEGVGLRVAGVTRPIMLIDGDVDDNASIAVEYGLTPSIVSEEVLHAYERAARSTSRCHSVWLAADVGFNRAGYREPADFARLAERAAASPHLHVQCVTAHLTHSNASSTMTEVQIERFSELTNAAVRTLGYRVETSLFASHGLVRWGRRFRTHWVRPGLLLYGDHYFEDDVLAEPTVSQAVSALRFAVRLRARVLHILTFKEADGVGYGHRQQAQPGQRLATVAFGFGGGYPGAADGASVIADGRRVPVFGEPGMDALQIDVTALPGLRRGDWVTLLGPGDETVSIRSLARQARTTPYQLLSGLRCQRRYLGQGEP